MNQLHRLFLAVIPAILLAAAAPQDPVVVSLREGTSMAAALSPDGTTIVIDLQGRLWTLPASGGAATPITDEFGDARQPAWSPDSRRIVFQSFRDGGWHVWTVNRDGSGLAQLTTGPFDDREPQFSPDASKVAFSSDRGGNYDIWELDLASRAITQRTRDTANDYFPAYAPDGSSIAFVSEREPRGVWSVARDGAERSVQAVAGAVAGPVWTRDGASVVFSVVANNQAQLMWGGQVLSSDEDVFPFRPTWSSSGDLVYTADGKIKKRVLGAGASPETIEFQATLSFARPSYVRKRKDFDSTTPRRVQGIVRPAISPDGRQIVFIALNDLWLLPVSGGSPKRITNDTAVEADPAWSPDGRLLAYSSDRSGSMDIWVRDMQTNEEQHITTTPGSETASTFSPDNTTIAFVNDAGAVYTIKVESQALRQVMTPKFAPGRPTWSNDGKTLLVSALAAYSSRFREGTTQLVAVSADGGGERRITLLPHQSAGSRENDGPVWSPDGTKVAVIIDGSLWTVPVTPSGEPSGIAVQLNREASDSPTWTRDSKSILYLANDRLKLVPAAGGVAREIPLNLAWSPKKPDGSFVVWARQLFDGRAATLKSDVDIVIEGNRIRAIEPHRDRPGARVVDAGDQVVMPGLTEMHAHLDRNYGSPLGRIWLAYGVTTVRNPASEPWQAAEIRESFESGQRPGPRVFSTGYTFDGSRVYYSGTQSIDSEREMDMLLDRALVMKYDLIKTYVRLPDTLQKRAIDFAHRNGLPVTSHEIYPAVAFGADGVEHIRGTSRRGYTPKASQLNRSYQDVIDLLTKSGMTVTPTIGISGGFGLMAVRDPQLLRDVRFSTLFPPGVVEQHRATAERAQRVDPRVTETNLKPYGDFVRKVFRGGGRIVAGTDAAIVPYAISLHTELEHFVDAGLTPFEALQTSLMNAAEALAAQNDIGSIEPGKLADLVFVEGNPLENIRNTRNVKRVIKNGELFEMDRLLK